ncbi:chromosome condensation regulator RCC1 [Actinoplanes xinjiangensis]|nr:chromosome condensation regulator RCC1 [Actinoplanes xinjiangensis]
MLMRTGLTVAMLATLTGPMPSPAPAVAVVSAGARHTCMLDGDGRAWCWGDNEYGQLGDGTQQDQAKPVPVAAPAGVSFTRLTVGGGHTCGLGSDATAYCWGDGTAGQVGNVQSGWFVDPMAVKAPAGVTFGQLAAGGAHTCGIGSDDRTYCWGDGAHGQRGNDSTVLHAGIAVVETPAGVTLIRIAAGERHTCGIGSDGKTYCWGDGRTTPAVVDTPPGVTLTRLHAGAGRTCGTGSDTRTYCWTSGRPQPAAVQAPAGVTFTQVDAGGDRTCAIGSDTTTYCWNDGRPQPAAVDTPDGVTFTQVDVGGEHTCAVTGDGRTYCWGVGRDGRLGNGDLVDQPRPVRVTPSPVPTAPAPARPTVELVAGLAHTCLRDDRGTAYCWGRNDEGALGNGSTTDRARPAAVSAPAGVTFRQLAPGGFHTCGIGSDTRTYCWGAGDHGQLGNGGTMHRTRPTAVDTPGDVTFTGLASGKDHTCAIGSDTKTYCWGTDFFGNLGNGAAPEQTRPAPVKAPAGVTFTQLTAGEFHTCGIGRDTKTYCWGSAGAVGDGGTEHREEPVAVRVPPAVAFTQIDAGFHHTCGLGDDSRIYCWGDNSSSNLGDGTDIDRSRPVPVKAPAGFRFIQVSAGGWHTCGLTGDNRAYCWGAGLYGVLGNGGDDNEPLPVAVLAPSGVAFTRLAAGDFHTCGLGDDGRTYCWGPGSNGELGNSDHLPQSRPVPVSAPALPPGRD